jgi:hypothetical protein
MKKFIVSILILAIIAVAIYWLFYKPADTTENPEPVPLTITGKSDAFRSAFGDLMSTYYSMRDAFVEWDTLAVNKAATTLQEQSEKLPMAELKADSSVVTTAKGYAESIVADAKGILGENNIEQKRRGFQVLSDNLFNLVRTVQYGGEKIYYQHCPMAFNDEEEANWLSNSSKVVNPYLGKHHPKYKAGMLHCGDVVDSVDYTRK